MPTLKHPRNWLVIATTLFAALQVIVLNKQKLPLWDEAVYTLMGRHLATLAEAGMWEILRPPLLPAALAPLELISNSLFTGGYLVLLIAIVGAWILYALLKDYVGEALAAGTAILLLFFELYFSHAHNVLTSLPAATLILAAAYTHHKDKHLFTGLLVALAFLTRFPAGLAIAAFGLVYLYRALAEWRKTSLYNQQTKALLLFSAPVLVLVGGWLLINWVAWRAETSVWWHAAFRPLIFGSMNVLTDNLALYNHTWTYYLTRLLATLPLILLAIPGGYALRKHHKLLAPVLTSVLTLLFFSAITNQQWRFALLALPGVFILIGLGARQVADMNFVRAKTVVAVLFIASILVSAGAMSVQAINEPSKPAQLQEAYTFLQENPVAGPIIVNDPVFGAYATHNKILPVYFETLPRFREALRADHDAVVFIPDSFPCYQEQEICQEELTHAIDVLTTTQQLIYQTTFAERDYYIFSDQEWFTGQNTDALRAEYGLGSVVTLSRHPADEFPVALILEDYPSLDADNHSRVWHEERFRAVQQVMQGIPATAAIIPEHAQTINDFNASLLETINSSFELAQNGDDHTDLPGTNQYARIQAGQEQMKTLFGHTPTTFIPPQYNADEETAQALDELGFEVYISTVGDSTEVSMTRLDQTTSLITNWEQNTHKPPEQVLEEVKQLRLYEQYALMNIFYFMQENTTQLNQTIQLLNEEFRLVTAGELADWLERRAQTTLDVQGTDITVQAPPSTQELTLRVHASGNYSVTSNVELHLKNAHTQEITVCIEDVCEELAPNHFFLSKSAMVIPPPELV